MKVINNIGKRVSVLGDFVCVSHTMPRKNGVMSFNHFHDTPCFPQSLKKYPLKGLGFSFLKGKIINESGHPSMEVESLFKRPGKVRRYYD